jgi:hypothetical protein
LEKKKILEKSPEKSLEKSPEKNTVDKSHGEMKERSPIEELEKSN